MLSQIIREKTCIVLLNDARVIKIANKNYLKIKIAFFLLESKIQGQVRGIQSTLQYPKIGFLSLSIQKEEIQLSVYNVMSVINPLPHFWIRVFFAFRIFARFLMPNLAHNIILVFSSVIVHFRLLLRFCFVFIEFFIVWCKGQTKLQLHT